MLYKNVSDLIQNIKAIKIKGINPVLSALARDRKQVFSPLTRLIIEKDGLNILDKEQLNKAIDELAENAALNDDLAIKKACHWLILKIGQKLNVYPASINDFYLARGRGEFKDLTVPAMNLRGLTYESAQAIFQTAIKKNIGAFIFELARTEMVYTAQPPIEYAAVILAAAIKQGFSGPIFIQLDHGQVNLKKYQENPEQELNNLKNTIKESIEAGFYNIDIDASTLVNLTQSSLEEQQRKNFETTAELTTFIRNLEPQDITVSIGGEIGEIGKKNSTPEELKAFLNGYNQILKNSNISTGLSKISVQSGTSHGGIMLADGKMADLEVDFNTLKNLGLIACQEYGLGGAVAHGASTLKDEIFNKFTQNQVLEIHLATAFQNIILDSQYFPQDLKEKMYDWMKNNCQKERKENWTDEQFLYNLRKKTWGAFEKEISQISPEIKEKFCQEIGEKFSFLAEQLNINNTRELIAKYIKPPKIDLEIPAELKRGVE